MLRRPDVTVFSDRTIKIHTFDERHPLNLTILHFPFCISFVFFVDNKNNYHMICDPNESEENSGDACLVIAANSYRQLLGLHCLGKPVIDSDIIINCSRIAIERSKKLTEFLKNSIESDRQKRSDSLESVGFANAIRTGIMSGIQKPDFNLLDVIKIDKIEDEEPMDQIPEEVTPNVYLYGRGIGSIGEGGPSKWQFTAPADDSEESNDVIIFDPKEEEKQKNRKTKSDDEEEDEIMIIESNDFKH